LSFLKNKLTVGTRKQTLCSFAPCIPCKANEPGYKEGLEPPDLDEDEGDYEPDPCEALGEDPDPEGQAYLDCMAASGEEEEVEEVAEEAADVTTESYSAQQDELELPNESQVVTKTVTLEYADGTTATVTETFAASN